MILSQHSVCENNPVDYGSITYDIRSFPLPAGEVLEKMTEGSHSVKSITSRHLFNAMLVEKRRKSFQRSRSVRLRGGGGLEL